MMDIATSYKLTDASDQKNGQPIDMFHNQPCVENLPSHLMRQPFGDHYYQWAN